MIYLNCHGAIYRMTEENAHKVIKMFADGVPFFLPDFGELWGDPVVGTIIDIGSMSREQAKAFIGDGQ